MRNNELRFLYSLSANIQHIQCFKKTRSCCAAQTSSKLLGSSDLPTPGSWGAGIPASVHAPQAQ